MNVAMPCCTKEEEIIQFRYRRTKLLPHCPNKISECYLNYVKEQINKIPRKHVTTLTKKSRKKLSYLQEHNETTKYTYLKKTKQEKSYITLLLHDEGGSLPVSPRSNGQLGPDLLSLQSALFVKGALA